jgi:hypothetical protein
LIVTEIVTELANTLVLGSFLEEVRTRWGSFELLDHWTQGEFHHDLVVRVPNAAGDLPGSVLVVATNCNGGVKEVLRFDEPPSRSSLWAMRCPDNDDFATAQQEDGNDVARPLARSSTLHWFDPCELLRPDARSELREEYRVRQPGGGWICGASRRDNDDG